MSSRILVDELQGKTTAGDITVTDASVTMKLQDGLAKVGIMYQLTSNVIQQSWNVSSVTDHGTGNFQVFYSNNVAGSAISVYHGSNGYQGVGEIFGNSTNSHYQRIKNVSGTLVDSNETYSSTHGDLA